MDKLTFGVGIGFFIIEMIGFLVYALSKAMIPQSAIMWFAFGVTNFVFGFLIVYSFIKDGRKNI